jgi:hypothetical protein
MAKKTDKKTKPKIKASKKLTTLDGDGDNPKNPPVKPPGT